MTLDSIAGKFKDVFYRDTVTVLKITVSGGYTKTEKVETLGTVTGDMQPYGGGLAQQEYGLAVECQKRFFCAANDAIRAGNHIDAGGVRYRIEYAENDRLGMTALLREVSS